MEQVKSYLKNINKKLIGGVAINEDIEKRDNISSIWNMLSTSLVFGLSTILLTRKYVWKSMKLEVDKEKKF